MKTATVVRSALWSAGSAYPDYLTAQAFVKEQPNGRVILLSRDHENPLAEAKQYMRAEGIGE